MTRAHHTERTAPRRRVGLVLIGALVLLAAACSSSVSSDSDSTASTTTAAPTVVPSSTTPTTTAAQAAGVVPIEGDGNQLVPVPASVGIPAIVHASYRGTGSFVVKSVDDKNKPTRTLVASLHGYDGTFPLGFDNTAVAMQVTADGPWHLDIAKAALAPQYAQGVSGTGDAVFSWIGPATDATIVHEEKSRFVARIYGQNRLTVLADEVGPLQLEIKLPKGPAFIAVSTVGTWSITPHITK